MAKRAATISPSSGDVEVYIAQAKASIAAELAPAAAAVSPFTIEVRFLGGLTPKQKNAFKSAADRWSRVIIGDLPSVKVDNEVIDDVVILAQGSPIDDVGRILGQAGPTHLRPQSAGVAAFLPAKGKMTFDTADLKQMEQDDTLNDVITHEMGHVLGIGTVWTFKSLLKGAGKTNPTFLGKAAMKEPMRWSRGARIWLVIEPQVVTVSTVLRRPAPAIRTHTLASRFDISSPAQRA